MKKFLLSAIVIMSACQLKAQQLQWFKPLDTLSNNFDRFSKIKPENQLQLFAPGINLHKILINPFLSGQAKTIDHMPIAVLEGNSKMPVAKIGGYYTMPVKHIGPDAGAQNVLPDVPTFKTP